MDNNNNRICRKCISIKNINDFNFSRNKKCILSRRHICKACEVIKLKEYYEQNKNKYKKYYELNKVKDETPKKRGRPKKNIEIIKYE
jgi:hypothetical protein